MVSYSRWSLNAGYIRFIKDGVLYQNNVLLQQWIANPLSNKKILDWSKLKAFADDKINVTQKLIFALGRVENIVGKGENAGYQHFLFFP